MYRLVWVWFFLFLAFPVVRSVAPRARHAAPPPDLGAAVATLAPIATPAQPVRAGGPLAASIPALTGLDGRPLAAADWRGRAVLVEFWTFDCFNCLRTVPAMRELDRRLAGSGVALLGIHTPELDHEREPANVKRAVGRLGIRYPVALDNSYGAWRAFGNHAWPALYLVGRDGAVVWRHVGELHEGTPAWNELLGRLAELGRAPA